MASDKKKKKLTVMVPEDLLKEALESSGDSISETVKHGLSLIIGANAARRLRGFRGKVKVSIKLDKLRTDQ